RLLAASEEGEEVVVIGPLGNTFADPDEPIAIVTDAPHAGTTLALCLERARRGLRQVVFFVVNPQAPHPSDDVLIEAFRAADRANTGRAGDQISDGSAPQTTVVATPLEQLAGELSTLSPSYIAAGASDAAMAIAQSHQSAAGTAGEAAMQAAMACGLGACQVCVRPRTGGGTFLVCDGPIFPLELPSFAPAEAGLHG
ncbi:MAG: hypothetical protein AAGF49_13465, partial [Pseudomonadota bacterium]